ncbi:hypothetical protein D3C73_1579190 [compost metagenome]
MIGGKEGWLAVHPIIKNRAKNMIPQPRIEILRTDVIEHEQIGLLQQVDGLLQLLRLFEHRLQILGKVRHVDDNPA